MDAVNPDHYKQGNVECIDGLESALSSEEFEGFLKGNILKYVWRESSKNKTEDLKKAQWYLNRLIKYRESMPQLSVLAKEGV